MPHRLGHDSDYLRCRKGLDCVQLFRHLRHPRQRKHLMETLACGDLRHAGDILFNSVNHMITAIQWNCEIKQCDHSQAPQANGNTCQRYMQHAYCTCPSQCHSTVWGAYGQSHCLNSRHWNLSNFCVCVCG